MASNSTAKRSARETVADRAATVARDFHDVGDAARQMANHSLEAVRDTAKQYLDDGRTHVRHLGEGMHTRVTEQPLKSLLIAAGIGFLIGAIWTRR
ncbi:MAG: YqjD family protein [Pirellulales bacterium]